MENISELISRGDYDEALTECYKMSQEGIDCNKYLYEIYKGMGDVKMACAYINQYLTSIPLHERNTSDYVYTLRDAFTYSLYDDIYSGETYTAIMQVLHLTTKPSYTNNPAIIPNPFKQLRVGLFSYDFKVHPVGMFILSLFKFQSGANGMEFYCYDTSPGEGDEITKLIQKHSFAYRKVDELPDEDITSIILKDSLDIVFDLNGLSLGHKLHITSTRLAPVQLSWIGFPITTCCENIDYTIVDEYTDPKSYASEFYTEKLLYMPRTFLCYSLDISQEIKPLPCIGNGYITFGSFSNALKFSDTTLALWASILERIPDSCLILRNKAISNASAMKHLKHRLSQGGIPLDRVILKPTAAYNEYLHFYDEIDIILDTFPFNGATTTCDAFNMGVPVISRFGISHTSRVGLSMLSNIGLKDLAVDSDEGYISKAIELANDVERLVFLRYNLRGMMRQSPLSDAPSFKKELENVLRSVFAEQCSASGIKWRYKDMDYSTLLEEICTGIRFISAGMDGVVDIREEVLLYCIERLQENQRELCGYIEANFGENREAEVYKRAMELLSQVSDKADMRKILNLCLGAVEMLHHESLFKNNIDVMQ